MSVIDFRRSRFFRELNVNEDQFTEIFEDLVPQVLIEEKNLSWVLERCDFFMMAPFDEFYPWRHRIRCLPPTVPLIRECNLVFFGGQKEVVRSLDLSLIRWVHVSRAIFTADVYSYLLESIDAKKEMNVMHILEYFYTQDIRPHDFVLRMAFQRGMLRIAEWLWTHGLPLTSYYISIVLEVSGNNTEYISRMIRDGCPIHSHVVASAASRGRLDFVKWWHAQGYPFCESAAAWAAVWGHVNIIRFLIDHGKPIDVAWTRSNAVRNNQYDVIHLLD